MLMRWQDTSHLPYFTTSLKLFWFFTFTSFCKKNVFKKICDSNYSYFEQIRSYFWILMSQIKISQKKKYRIKMLLSLHTACIYKSYFEWSSRYPLCSVEISSVYCSSSHYLFTFISIIALCLRVICAWWYSNKCEKSVMWSQMSLPPDIIVAWRFRFLFLHLCRRHRRHELIPINTCSIRNQLMPDDAQPHVICSIVQFPIHEIRMDIGCFFKCLSVFDKVHCEQWITSKWLIRNKTFFRIFGGWFEMLCLHKVSAGRCCKVYEAFPHMFLYGDSFFGRANEIPCKTQPCAIVDHEKWKQWYYYAPLRKMFDGLPNRQYCRKISIDSVRFKAIELLWFE